MVFRVKIEYCLSISFECLAIWILAINIHYWLFSLCWFWPSKLSFLRIVSSKCSMRTVRLPFSGPILAFLCRPTCQEFWYVAASHMASDFQGKTVAFSENCGKWPLLNLKLLLKPEDLDPEQSTRFGVKMTDTVIITTHCEGGFTEEKASPNWPSLVRRTQICSSIHQQLITKLFVQKLYETC